MKQIFIRVVIIVAIIVTVGWNFSQNRNEIELSDLALANVEALAKDEGSQIDCGGSGNGCYNGLWYPHYEEKNE